MSAFYLPCHLHIHPCYVNQSDLMHFQTLVNRMRVQNCDVRAVSHSCDIFTEFHHWHCEYNIIHDSNCGNWLQVFATRGHKKCLVLSSPQLTLGEGSVHCGVTRNKQYHIAIMKLNSYNWHWEKAPCRNWQIHISVMSCFLDESEFNIPNKTKWNQV